jgi:hypothetical protein
MPEPPPSRLRQLLEQPDGRRVRDAVVALLALAIGTIAVLGALVIWHLVRRGRLIRDRLGPPRAVDLPVFRASEPESLSRSQTKPLER